MTQWKIDTVQAKDCYNPADYVMVHKRYWAKHRTLLQRADARPMPVSTPRNITHAYELEMEWHEVDAADIASDWDNSRRGIMTDTEINAIIQAFVERREIPNNDQAIELVKHFKLDIMFSFAFEGVKVVGGDGTRIIGSAESADLNTAIIDCVAQIQAVKVRA